MNEILAKQLAIDFCTDVNSILSKENVFTEYKQLEGRRIFKEGECYFKAASVNGLGKSSRRKMVHGLWIWDVFITWKTDS